MANLLVKFAVYGAPRGGNQDNTEAAVMTQQLQEAINRSPNGNGVVKINNANMGGDPARGVDRHFGAIVEINDVDRAFACPQGQTIDFS